jgi:dienelactone hydrolase
MRLAAAAAIAVCLAGCGFGTAPPTAGQAPAEAAPAPATLAELSPYYGSYVTAAGDTIVIARLGWFFDFKSSAYRTIYAGQSSGRFSIGCRFLVPVPKCADLAFTQDVLTVRDASHSVTTGHRVGNVATDVSIPAAGAQLAGTITRPSGGGTRGGVVIIHGSEPGQRYFYDIWVGLYTSLGLAVLTYDKRGNGNSTGRYPGEFPTTEALQIYADDAAVALAFLARSPGIDPGKVGFHGGSQGGWTVPLAISRHPGAAFAILVSAPATTVDQTDQWSGYSGGGAFMPAQSTGEMLAAVRATHSGYDPLPALRVLSIPTLWLLGTNDRTVPTAVCVEILSGLHKTNFTVQMLPTGHGLLVNPTGLQADDERSSGLAPELVPKIGSWLQAM